MLSKRTELIRIHREPPLGKIVVEVNGRFFRDLAAVDDPAVRGLLLAAAGDLVVFAGGYQALVDAGIAPPLAGQRAVPPPPVTAPAPPASTQPTPPQAPPLPTAAPAEARPAPDPDSLVGQIDAILQQLLLARPEFAGRTIQLRQGIKGGLQIEVDGRYYQQPTQINDPAVQQVLRQALQIWEKR